MRDLAEPGRSPDARRRTRRRGHHAGLRWRVRGAAQGRQLAADAGGLGIAAGHHRRTRAHHTGHSRFSRRNRRRRPGRSDRPGASYGWWIRSTAPASSSSATASSPSISHWLCEHEPVLGRGLRAGPRGHSIGAAPAMAPSCARSDTEARAIHTAPPQQPLRVSAAARTPVRRSRPIWRA